MSNIKKYTFLLLACLLISITVFAQEEEENNDQGNEILQKLVFGGNVGGGYANGWNINLSPTIGYKVTNTTIAGVGFNYIYSDFNNPYFSANRTTYTTTGGRLFIQQLLFQNLYAQAEYEYLDYSLKVRSRGDGRVIDEITGQAPGLLLGGGYTTSFGYGLGMNIEVLYNVLYKEGISPYPSPLIIRGGLMYGF